MKMHLSVAFSMLLAIGGAAAEDGAITVEIKEQKGSYYAKFFKPADVHLHFKAYSFEEVPYDVEFYSEGAWKKAELVFTGMCGNNDLPENYVPPKPSVCWIYSDSYYQLFFLESYDTKNNPARIVFNFSLDRDWKKTVLVYSKPFVIKHLGEQDAAANP